MGPAAMHPDWTSGPPPPIAPRFLSGKKSNLQKEILVGAIFGAQTFGFQTPPPPYSLPLAEWDQLQCTR